MLQTEALGNKVLVPAGLILHQLVWSYPEAWWKMATVSAWFGMVMVFYVIFNEGMQRFWLVVCSFAWNFCGSG